MITQQHACYAAEDSLERGKLFKSVADVQRFVDAMRDERWWILQRYPLYVIRIEVGAAKGTSSVGWFDKDKGAGRIELVAQHLDTKTVLHEMAHVLASAVHRSKSHDPWWARTYLTLVSCVMGPEAYLALRNAFDAKGVDYDVKTTTGGAIAL